MRVPAILNSKPAQYAMLGIGAYLLVVYVLPKLTLKLAQTPGNVLNSINQGLGSNDLTNNQTDFSGAAVDGYSDHGALSTLAAGANSISGGLFASFGEWIGGKVADLTQPDFTQPTPSGISRTEVVTPNYVTSTAQLGAGQ